MGWIGSAAILLTAGGAFATSVELKQTSIDADLADVRFGCEFVDGQYTVMYYPEGDFNQGQSWATPVQLGGGWTPERRCNEISRRLEFYRPDGLQELTTGMENGYDTVCVTTERNPSCRIVLTVPPGQDPIATRDRVFENIVVADSGQSTEAVTTFRGDGVGDLLNQLGDALNLDLPGRTRPSNRPTGRPGVELGSPRAIDLRPFLDPADGGTGERLR
jgi:hypothetical protein